MRTTLELTGALRADYERDGAAIVLRLSGEFDQHTGPVFDAAIEPVAVGRRREFAIDVRDVTYADSAFLRSMVALHTTHGPVAILNPTSEVRRLVEAAEAQHVLVIRTDNRP